MSLALIAGAGSGLSAALARTFSKAGYNLMLAARDAAKLEALCAETGARAVACDVSRTADVNRLFAAVDAMNEPLSVAVYHAGARLRGPIMELKPAEVEAALRVGAFGGFLVAQAAARRMVPRGTGTILFTGASASVKGYALSAPFAMTKFALRGLAQSLAREVQPKGIHVAHVVIDGAIRNDAQGRGEPPGKPDSMLDPDAIAQTYLALARQPRSAWTLELELRPWVETF